MYVASENDDTLTVLKATSGEYFQTSQANATFSINPGPTAMAVSGPYGGSVYLTESPGDALAQLSGVPDSSASVISTGCAWNSYHGFAVDSLHDRVYADFRTDEMYFVGLFNVILTLYGIPFGDPGIIDLLEELRPETSHWKGGSTSIASEVESARQATDDLLWAARAIRSGSASSARANTTTPGLWLMTGRAA